MTGKLNVDKTDNTVTLDANDAPTATTASVSWIPDTQELGQQRLGAALYRLQQWLMEMHQRKLAQEDEGIVRLNEEVAARFALGLKPDAAFIVMPELEAAWATMIPWSHAAMHEDDPTVYLVTENFEIDGEMTPDFGISFKIPDFAKAQALSLRKEIQLRRFIKKTKGWSVSPTSFVDMPLIILTGGDRPFDKRGKKMKLKGNRA